MRIPTKLRTAGVVSLIILLSPAVFGQSVPSPAFEVASVKLHQGGWPRISISTSGPRLEANAANLVILIMYAYDLNSYQVPRTPPLLALGDEFYDIEAKAEGNGAPTKAEFGQMLQSLLADRFKLKVHRERREMPVYALVVGKNGPKFKESAPDASPDTHYAAGDGRNYEITMPKARMESLLGAIENSLTDRPVLDKTGLTGTYNIKMTYTPATKANLETPDLSDISIFAAVEQQLGLKLEAQKAMIEVLVVDHIEKPSVN